MGGPIISGGKPWLEALFFLTMISLFCVLMSPELASMITGHIPRLTPVLEWLHRVLD
jgi:hypothetical protein